MKTTWLMAVLVMSSAVRAEDACERQLTVGLSRLGEVAAGDRATLVLGTAASVCASKLPRKLQENLSALTNSSPDTRMRMLAGASSTDEARESFEAACPGWGKSKLADAFIQEGQKLTGVFKQCDFARFKVVTAAEFAKADPHFATTALVLYDTLVKSGVKVEVAKKAARGAIVPLETK